MKFLFHVDKAKVAQATALYLNGLFFGLFFNHRFENYAGTVEVNCDGYQLLDYLVLYERGIYQVYIY
ncbi:MAG: hypothetical protein ACHQHN_19310 [Sphingobacteriales bacterium]